MKKTTLNKFKDCNLNLQQTLEDTLQTNKEVLDLVNGFNNWEFDPMSQYIQFIRNDIRNKKQAVQTIKK